VGTRYGGELRVLDAETGGRLDSIRIDRLDLHFANTETDRIFLGTKEGLLMCLHEIGQDAPLLHNWPQKQKGPQIGPMIGPADDVPAEEMPAEGEGEPEGEAEEMP
jgi:hypothetical protein